MDLTQEQLDSNWEVFINFIDTYIKGERGERLKKFYEERKDDISIMPASHKKQYHNCFKGGYVEHVNRVVRCALKQATLWDEEGCDISTFTTEELVFAALNHDLGKIGDGTTFAHIPSKNKWRRDNLGEMYEFDSRVEYMPVPERSLFLLCEAGVTPTFNEWVAIKTHDGLYDPANESYLKTYTNETKFRTSLPYIVHQADLMAARIEWEREWLPSFNSNVPSQEDNFTLSKNTANKPTKAKALNPNKDISGLMDTFFD